MSFSRIELYGATAADRIKDRSSGMNVSVGMSRFFCFGEGWREIGRRSIIPNIFPLTPIPRSNTHS